MKSKHLVLAATFLAGGLFALIAVPAGCESDSCTKDTDCELPLVCVRSACVHVGPQPDVGPVDDGGFDVDADGTEADTDGGGDDGIPPEVDADVDVDVDADDEGGGGDGDADADGDAGCTPVTSAAVSMNSSTGAVDGNERVAVARSGSGFVWLGRPPGPTAGDGLFLGRFDLTGRAIGTAIFTLSGVEIAPQHPVVVLPDETVVTAFAVPSDAGIGIWTKIVPLPPATSVTPRKIDGTDETCGSPTITYDGTNLVVGWTDDDGAGNVQIFAGHFSPATGAGLDTPALLLTGPTGTGEPRIVFSTIRHALAYIDATDGALHVRSLDGTFAQIAESILPTPASHTVVGYPALVWNGTVYGLLWETRGTGSSTMHFATFAPDETPVEHDILGTVSLSSAETGQVALAWAQEQTEWGVAWRNNQTGRVTISFVRVDADTFALKEGPVDVRTEATTAWYPSVAYNLGYYMFGWIEQAGALYPMYASTRGCPL
ncbi:MAG: hypothetical protein HY905_06080 [Deltaproteobacteria bacterium]|nr:hypothetical protein [Deltaproteobacteria bacterium]